MKLHFEEPMVEVIKLNQVDILTESNCDNINPVSGKDFTGPD